MPFHPARIAIIGCGHVGTTCAYALLQSRLCREIVLIDRDEDRAKGEALDLQQSVPLGMPVKIFAGDYEDAAASAIVVLTVGAPGKFPGSRLDLLAANIEIVSACVGKLMAQHFDGVLLLTTNPVDILTLVAQRDSRLPVNQVIGSGTLIDTERFRSILGESLNVDARSVDAVVIGEHGDSSVAVWSAAHVGGAPLAAFPEAGALPSREKLLARVRRAGPEVIALKGNTCFAIASCVTRICEAILRDERAVLVVSTLMTGEYGLRDVCLSTPCVIGKTGVARVLVLSLDAAEQKALEHSAAILRRAYAAYEAS
ncbi:L-lactate dehydrogenase [Rhodoblastus sphagnicola]|uniref:L-lactate dehydrogenase n=1 Tax=Rhodoblastus sphagnicola TaxID=333368 RepID=A0A2S6N1X9_9HYPH|nr:L-lactate dehydrogenase [Rhodoblastus sphagnicola]MBB4198255.1 L-lactate dehydrogenase [Rhodoblastus sphagnicola]PPQ28606.1 L-lactate dehydrogenase [Rhodoblastus sphagnicola]